MTRIEDDEHFYFKHRNDDGWIIALNRVMSGTRSVIYHENDYIFLNGNFCGGADPTLCKALYENLFRWLATNPKTVAKTCAVMHQKEKTRPFGEDIMFMKWVTELPQAEVELQCQEESFGLKPIVFV